MDQPRVRAAVLGTLHEHVAAVPFGDDLLLEVAGGVAAAQFLLEGAAQALYFSIFHGKTLVNGYSGFTSLGPAFVNERLFEFPAEEARVLLGALGVHAALVRETSPALLEQRLAGLPAGARVIARHGSAALVHVDVPPPSPPPPAVPLARAGWTLAASPAEAVLPALLDGDPHSTWRGTAAPDAVPSLTIDLGAVRTVRGVRCVMGSVDAAGRRARP